MNRDQFIRRITKHFNDLVALEERTVEDQKVFDPYQFREAIVRLGICCELLSELVNVFEDDVKLPNEEEK